MPRYVGIIRGGEAFAGLDGAARHTTLESVNVDCAFFLSVIAADSLFLRRVFHTWHIPRQGMNLIKKASEHFGWNVDLGECARIWKGGCIIRAAFLDDIKRAYVLEANLDNLLVDPDFSVQILERQAAWRRVVTLCVASGIAAPAMTASLSYFDAYRRARLPANLVQVWVSRCCVRAILVDVRLCVRVLSAFVLSPISTLCVPC